MDVSRIVEQPDAGADEGGAADPLRAHLHGLWASASGA